MMLSMCLRTKILLQYRLCPVSIPCVHDGLALNSAEKADLISYTVIPHTLWCCCDYLGTFDQ